MICLSCNKRPGTPFHCQDCLDRQLGFRKPGDQFEFTTMEIKDARIKHGSEIIQPFREGKISKRFIEEHGTKGIQVSKKEIKEAMNKPDVWGLGYYDE